MKEWVAVTSWETPDQKWRIVEGFDKMLAAVAGLKKPGVGPTSLKREYDLELSDKPLGD